MVRHLPLASEQFVNFDRLFFADHTNGIQLACFNIVLRQLISELTEHGVRVVLLVRPLEPCRDVHRIADHGVIEPILGTHVTHRHLAGIDADADIEPRKTLPLPFRPEAFERLDKLSKEGGAPRGIPTGFTGIDEKLSGLQNSDLIILAARPSLGKSTLALCMARGAASSGQKVLLVDGDLRRPSIEKKLGVSEKKKGLTDLVRSHDENISDYIFKDKDSELLIMPKGGAEYVSPTDIFTSHRMGIIVEALKKQFDLIIFDTPPVMAVADARALATQVDKTVFAVRWDHTPRKVVKAALQHLANAEPNLAGVVLQRVDLKQYGTYGYGYGDSGHYYHYGKYGQYYSS